MTQETKPYREYTSFGYREPMANVAYVHGLRIPTDVPCTGVINGNGPSLSSFDPFDEGIDPDWEEYQAELIPCPYCEGGEYDIFTLENEDLIREKVGKIVGEWHLGTPALKEKFKEFRNTYLIDCEDYRIFSIDGIDIKWDVWSDRFVEYYTEVMVYIDNRKK